MMLKLEDLALERIAWAMQDDGSMGAEFYLNLDTGDVVLPGFEEDLDQSDIEEGNFASIDHVESYESFRHMEDFAYALPEGEARTKLEQTLIRSKPFRHFRDVLGTFPEEREAWYRFKDEAMRAVVIRWLVGIKAIEDPDPDDAFGTEQA
ncbi:UPF0158 family protein [Paeniglutamicibacter sp. ABSL32-1]|uniref:UPF0158 family protein n=1 Tax=Paeniglutamicibacter quisquiliarum TaxID=2849498 RepID=UPI001C2CEF2E|nr:UPF0158 family protein [Paeniglutamicibacter quisquiliarum]MBV1777750.1 UPF0158 family protein [Paeniglutamicibacter quisquiliarum]